MRWPWQKPTFPELKRVVDGIPLRDLPGEVCCFADCASRTKDPQTRRMHMAKVQYGCDRLTNALQATEQGTATKSETVTLRLAEAGRE